jgi:hypothetical protein
LVILVKEQGEEKEYGDLDNVLLKLAISGWVVFDDYRVTGMDGRE